MNERTLILGTRTSSLALAQTNWIRALLHRADSRLDIEIKHIKTTGDRLTTAALARSDVKGLFTKELEQALLRKQIHIAVHSLKDLPTELPAGLELGAVAEREDPHDVLICHPSTSMESPQLLYTSSPRRTFQAQRLWPHCVMKEIRGNVETRLHKLAEAKPGAALLLAAAGLKRLEYLVGDPQKGLLRFDPPLPYRRLHLEEMIPAPGQAAIALEIAADDGVTRERLKSVNHFSTWAAVSAERAFLQSLGGGCATPIAAHGMIVNGDLHLSGVVFRENGDIWRGQKKGPRREAVALGQSLASDYRNAS